MEVVPVIKWQETECQGCYKLAQSESCDGRTELSDSASPRKENVIEAMNSSDPSQPKVFRRRKSSVWSINAESRTDNGLEKFIERKTDFRTFFILDFETGK